MNTINKKLAVTVTPITIEELRNNSASEYNRTEWNKKIDLYARDSKNAQFYIKPSDSVFSYDRFYVKHTIEEGITFLSQFGYSSSLTSNGFCLIEIEATENENVNIFKSYYPREDGSAAGISNTKDGRKWMSSRSKALGEIFANSI